jgi:hypothetical protein
MLVASATWSAPVDLDLALVTPRGERLSALVGSRAGGVAIDSRDGRSAEQLRLAYLPNGEYRLEIGRAVGGDGDGGSVSGTILVRAGAKSRAIPFVVASAGPRSVARIKVERLYPLY